MVEPRPTRSGLRLIHLVAVESTADVADADTPTGAAGLGVRDLLDEEEFVGSVVQADQHSLADHIQGCSLGVALKEDVAHALVAGLIRLHQVGAAILREDRLPIVQNGTKRELTEQPHGTKLV